MTFSEEQIEWIVREVVRRLREMAATPEGGRAREQLPKEKELAWCELAIDDRVITMRTIEGKLQGVSQVRIAPRAVVTPLVRDEFRQRKITILRQS